MRNYPATADTTNRIEPVPRRIRAVLGNETVLDTTDAVYVWEIANYPQYYLPAADFIPGALVDEDHEQKLRRGTARVHALHGGTVTHPAAARVYGPDAGELSGMVRVEWAAAEAWFEEDEQIFVHPRNPYSRVDALRSSRRVTVELDGVVLAESSATVMVFETGLPTRYYFPRLDVTFAHLRATETVSSCPYKGRTTGYWAVQTPTGTYPDLAWAYDFPTHQLLPIAGLVAFYNEKLDISVDGVRLERPVTGFS